MPFKVLPGQPSVSFKIPVWDSEKPWEVELDTSQPQNGRQKIGPEQAIEVAGRAVILLLRKR